jgi:hypothetical protein
MAAHHRVRHVQRRARACKAALLHDLHEYPYRLQAVHVVLVVMPRRRRLARRFVPRLLRKQEHCDAARLLVAQPRAQYSEPIENPPTVKEWR